MKIGFIGLGNMGFRMSKNLAKKAYSLIVYDINKEAVENLAAMGAEKASSPRELAAKSDVIITMLPNSKLVEMVVLGANGVIEGIKKGSVLIDMSSSNPESTKRISAELVKNGADMIDAPVSGGIAGAENATLAIMVGGQEETVKTYIPLLEAMGKKITVMGPIGAGHTMKVVNNYLSACAMAATAEAVTVAAKAGLSPQRVIEVIQGSTGRSDSSDRKFPNYVFKNEKYNFSIDLICKDLALYIDVAKEMKVPALISNVTYQLWEIAKAEQYTDMTDIVDLYEKWCNINMRK